MIRLKTALIAIGLALSPASAMAAAPVVAPAAEPAPVAAVAPAPVAAAKPEGKAAAAKVETTIGTSKPVHDIGQPVPGSEAIGLQPQVTELGRRAAWMHDWILMPIMVIISLFVLGLLLWVMAFYRQKANPVASKTSHNTFIEIVWTLVPVLVLIGISIPSISLLAAQFKPAPKDAVTLKAIGSQWLWSYEYPDHKIAEFQSNMLSDADAKAKGEPRLLGVDNRVVLPVNTPIRLITTAADVIHSWAVPAFWIKMDSVPGRLNETSFTVDKTGVYYGQCSELCGIKHGFMPIAVEVVSKEDFATWVRAKGGQMPGDAAPEAAAKPAAAPAAAAPSPAPAAAPAAAPAEAKK